MFRILLFSFFLINISITSFAEDTPLLERKKTFQKAKEYTIHKTTCDGWLSRMVVVDGISYANFLGSTSNDGIIIVFDTLVPYIKNIFNELKNEGFPIGGIDPFYGVNIQKEGDEIHFIVDDEYNYTGSYACRNQIGNSKTSMHSYGMAVDINPLQNPYLRFNENGDAIQVIPKKGGLFVNRSTDMFKNGMVNQKVVEIFTKNGFITWGGTWKNPKDYHHFEVNPDVATILLDMNMEDGMVFFQKLIDFRNKTGKNMWESVEFKRKANGKSFVNLYKYNKKTFMKVVTSL